MCVVQRGVIMADLADLASDRIEQHQADSERHARGKSGPESHPDFDGAHCVDCEDTIPEARLLLGKIRCVSCQEVLESRKARGLA